ncbi:MAG: sigma-70 family RNA polymerase sigma factor [Clostridia bacterium]|nr:sigma-70 family RNA polymerase sigma factor [Clostridia bacterium]
MDEKDTVQMAANGDESAFENLVRTYQSRVYAICLSMLKNPEDAEDAAQEAFVKCFRSMSAFRGDSSFYTWLCRLTMNVCLDALRAKKEAAADIDECFDLADEKEGVEDRVLREERRRVVRSAIGKLPVDFRMPLILRDMQSLSYEEIGNALDLSCGTVKSRLFRARDKLREILMQSELFNEKNV